MNVQFKLSGQRILVTGARGFIGSHLCDRLMAEGAEVHGVSRFPVTAGGDRIHWWQGDLLDLKNLRGLLRQVRPDFVFHLSGHVSAAPQEQNVFPTFHGLLTSTVNLLTLLSSEFGCTRIILTGSLLEPPPGSVDTPPSSPYAAAKWAGIAYGRMFHSLYRTPVVITRPYMVYGPRQHPSKIVPYTISSLAQGIPPSLSSGTWSADWIYVSDVIEGMIRAATVRDIEGCTIDFGCGELTPIKEVIRHILKIMKSSVQPVFGMLPDQANEVIRIADVEHTYAKLGWQPTVSIDEGLAATVRAFRDQFEAPGKTPIVENNSVG